VPGGEGYESPRPVRIGEMIIATKEDDSWMGIQVPSLKVEALWLIEVIAIRTGYVFSGRLANPEVEGGNDPAVRLMK